MNKDTPPLPDSISIVTDLTSTSIRSQLLWSSLFPLLIFSLLTILVISNVLDRSTLQLAEQRNTAWVQLISKALQQKIQQKEFPSENDLNAIAASTGLDPNISITLVDTNGVVVLASGQNRLPIGEGTETLSGQNVNSASYPEGWFSVSAPIIGSEYRIILFESEKAILSSQRNYQVLLAGMILLGVGLSLVTLSLSIRRIIQPIQFMAQQANKAVPGSTFRPLRETGPEEIRALINAFNKMVIRLAKQQTAIRQYAHKALLSQEEERLRLSHELHDGTLQDLVALNQRVELCQNELLSNQSQAQERLVEIHKLLQSAITDVRHISIALRPPALEDFGLVAAVEALCKESNKNNPTLECKFKINGDIHRLSADMELAVFRVVQEALTNIHKHVPGATQVTVSLNYTKNHVTTEITNDGGSFTPPDIQRHVRSGHMGLAGMQERAKLFNGTFNIATITDGLTRISLSLPIRDEDSHVF